MKKIRFFELFSGVGAPRSAFDRLKDLGLDIDVETDVEFCGYSEIDKYAIQSYKLLYNDDNNYGDISKIDKLPENLDLVFHGSPCQDFSLAGLGKGGEVGSGTRSSLLWETVRLVSDAKPKVVIWENVQSVTFKKHRPTFDAYLDHMESLGYHNHWKVIQGTDFNVPQTRPRVFVVSTLNDIDFKFPTGIPTSKILADCLDKEVPLKYYLSQEQVDSIVFTDKMNKSIVDKAVGSAPRSRECAQAGFRNEVIGTLCARDYKDPKVVIEKYDKPDKVGNLGFIKFNSRSGVYSTQGVAPTLNACGGGNTQVKIIEKVGNDVPSGHSSGNIYSSEGICPTLTTGNHGKPVKIMLPVDEGIPIKSATKQGYKIAKEGDGVYVTHTKNKRGMVQHQRAQTLTTSADVGVIVRETSEGISYYTIRKLTPTEYWRLMDFSEEQINKVTTTVNGKQVISNSQLYKQAGNSIIVSIPAHIIKSLIEQGAFE